MEDKSKILSNKPQFNIAHKVGFVFIIQTVFVLVLFVFNIQIFTEFNNGLRKISHEESPKAILALQSAVAVTQVQQWITDVIATRRLAGLKEAEIWALDFRNKITTLKHLEQAGSNNELLINTLDNAEKTFDEYYQAGKTMVTIYLEQGTDAGNVAMDIFDVQADSMVALMGKVQNNYMENLKQTSEFLIESNTTQSRLGIAILLSLLLISGVILFYLITVLTRDIIEPIGRITDLFKDLQEANLNVSMPVIGNSVIKQLCLGFNQCVKTLAASKMQCDLVNNQAKAIINENLAYKHTINIVPVGIMLMNLEGIITNVNAAAERTLSQVKQFLPISVDGLVGSNIRLLLNDQSDLLLDDKKISKAISVTIGDQKLELILNALYDSDGHHSGTMIICEINSN